MNYCVICPLHFSYYLVQRSINYGLIEWLEFYVSNLDTDVNQIATVLKMLYLSDFREMQNDLNALIVLGQEYTANP